MGVHVEQNFPEECTKFFNGSAKVLGSGTPIHNCSSWTVVITLTSSRIIAAFTSANDSFLYSDCDLTNEADGSTFHYASGVSLFSSGWELEAAKATYNTFAQMVIPVLTIFLPIADVHRKNTIGTATSNLLCGGQQHQPRKSTACSCSGTDPYR